MNKHQPILLTGAARSGTTWAGTIISQAKGVKYIFEPFNPFNRSTPVKYFYEFINENTEIGRQNEIKEYLGHFLDSYPEYLAFNLSKMFRKRTLIRLLNKDFFLKHRFFIINFLRSPLANRTLFKAPSALLSSEWIQHTFNTNNVILLRHPAAFAASYKVANWIFDFTSFRLQTGLMNNYLPQFKKQVDQYSVEPPDIIDQSILLWNILNTVIYDLYQKHNDDWYFVRHEDLSCNPVSEFKKLFLHLDLPYTQEIEKIIFKTTNGTNNRMLERDSRKNIWAWQNRLTKQEIRRVWNGTHHLSKHFYPDEEWAPYESVLAKVPSGYQLNFQKIC